MFETFIGLRQRPEKLTNELSADPTYDPDL